MKTTFTLLFLVLIVPFALAQKKEKIKGSRTVTIEQKEIAPFENIQISDNLEVFLVRGSAVGLEIEADDNLHDAISFEVIAGHLILSSTKDVTSSKKFSVKITYTGNLDMLTLKDNVLATALDKMELDNVSIKMFDSAKFFATIVCKNFTLMGNDKTKTELNLNAEKTAIDLSKNAYLKALISSSSMTFDMYQKSVAIIEGDVIDSKLRLENNAVFTGKKFTTYTCALVTESYTTSTIIVEKSISIDASGKSETHLMGNPKIEIKNFADNAILAKK
jgi:hypothetical protein